MTEQQAIERIHSVYPSGKKEGLTNMRALMARLGNPQERLRMVHVAGTNGKGSCCAMIERTLREAGYRTGLYTSPYIERYNERIRIAGVPIEGEKLAGGQHDVAHLIGVDDLLIGLAVGFGIGIGGLVVAVGGALGGELGGVIVIGDNGAGHQAQGEDGGKQDEEKLFHEGIPFLAASS